MAAKLKPVTIGQKMVLMLDKHGPAALKVPGWELGLKVGGSSKGPERGWELRT